MEIGPEPFDKGLTKDKLDTERMRMTVEQEMDDPNNPLAEQFCDNFESEVENVEPEQPIAVPEVISTMHLIVDNMEQSGKNESTIKLRKIVPKATYSVLPTSGLTDDEVVALKTSISILHAQEKGQRNSS